MALSNLQAGIDNRVLVNAVDINGKFKISAVSNDVLKIQRVDGTTLYDSFELSFNPVNKTSILTINNVDILQAINNNDVSVNVYRKSEVDTGLNLKAYKTDNFPKAEVNVALGILQAGIDRRVLSNAVDINGKFNMHDVPNDILKSQRVDGTTLYDSFELSFTPVDKTSILTLNNVNILQAINNNDVSANVYSKAEVDTGLHLKANKTDMYTNNRCSCSFIYFTGWNI